MKNAPVYTISAFPWDEGGYRPESFASLALRDGDLDLSLYSRQEAPRAEETRYGGPICRDDCLEFFFMPRPETGLYLNFEVNALGVYHLGLGTGRHGRAVFVEPAEFVTVTPRREAGLWGARVRFGPEFFVRWFGGAAQALCRGNFYKCADAADRPHWGMHFPYDLPQPDFHRPELFGHIHL